MAGFFYELRGREPKDLEIALVARRVGSEGDSRGISTELYVSVPN
jgi:hypothetical protein